jgi:TPR repeat protein
MKSRHLLLTLLLLFGLSGVIHAENSLTLEDLGLPPLPDSSPSAVLKFEDAQKKALNGDAKAQFQLGWMYSKGQGVPKDNTEALKWYRLAAEQGDAKAQRSLGSMYSEEKEARFQCASAAGQARSEYAAQQIEKTCLVSRGYKPEPKGWLDW